MICNNELEALFGKLNEMVSAETIMNYPDWKILSTLHPHDYGKPLGGAIRKINKPIEFFSVISKNQNLNIL